MPGTGVAPLMAYNPSADADWSEHRAPAGYPTVTPPRVEVPPATAPGDPAGQMAWTRGVPPTRAVAWAPAGNGGAASAGVAVVMRQMPRTTAAPRADSDFVVRITAAPSTRLRPRGPMQVPAFIIREYAISEPILGQRVLSPLLERSMRAIRRRRTIRTGRLSAVAAALGVAILVIVSVQVRGDRATPETRPPASTQGTNELDGLGAQARCDRAAALVTAGRNWPVECRWRQSTDLLQGQAFPPPAGDPPFDRPHVEIYVAPAQSSQQLGHAIAHELGHMYHTRDYRFVPEWLAERHLPADTPWEVWSEDYAEVFSTLFGPAFDPWGAATARPGAEELARLKGRFFAGV